MTNKQIILLESVKLMEDGILKPTDEKIIVEYEGEKKELQIPEPIHTFNGWKERGYSVKKGEKSKIKFAIWKYTAKKIEVENKDGENEETERENMFLKMSAFFTADQVERVKEE